MVSQDGDVTQSHQSVERFLHSVHLKQDYLGSTTKRRKNPISAALGINPSTTVSIPARSDLTM